MDFRHGTERGYREGCKCPNCRLAHSNHQANWRRRRAAGITCVDPKLVQRRILALQGTGLPLREIARRAGLNKKTVWMYANGLSKHYAVKETYDAVMGVKPGDGAALPWWRSR